MTVNLRETLIRSKLIVILVKVSIIPQLFISHGVWGLDRGLTDLLDYHLVHFGSRLLFMTLMWFHRYRNASFHVGGYAFMMSSWSKSIRSRNLWIRCKLRKWLKLVRNCIVWLNIMRGVIQLLNSGGYLRLCWQRYNWRDVLRLWSLMSTHLKPFSQYALLQSWWQIRGYSFSLMALLSSLHHVEVVNVNLSDFLPPHDV